MVFTNQLLHIIGKYLLHYVDVNIIIGNTSMDILCPLFNWICIKKLPFHCLCCILWSCQPCGWFQFVFFHSEFCIWPFIVCSLALLWWPSNSNRLAVWLTTPSHGYCHLNLFPYVWGSCSMLEYRKSNSTFFYLHGITYCAVLAAMVN